MHSLKIEPEVFAIHGVEPEVLAYAMAKYSRSALSMKASLEHISSQKASEFLNTFYFSYGHRSIADMAHVPMALENISLLAAIEVVDEQRWDGQERSTRYQDFSRRLYYTPQDLNGVEEAHYHQTIGELFDAYDDVFATTVKHYNQVHAIPEGMDKAQYDRTVRARAFDIARSLLPMATLTSVGQVVSARTLEGQISRMLASPFAEVRDVAQRMARAATFPAFNPNQEVLEAVASEIRRNTDDLSAQAIARQAERLAQPVNSAPTLVKYVEPNVYRETLRKLALSEFKEVSTQEIDNITNDDRKAAVRVTWPDRYKAEDEIIATLLYEHCNHPYEHLLRWVGSGYWGNSRRWNFLNSAISLRPRHEELPRAFRALGGIAVDVYMDIGGFRDLHRHRRIQQFFQSYIADDFATSDVADQQTLSMPKVVLDKIKPAFDVFQTLRRMNGHSVEDAAYLLPLGTKRRFLMKMDLGEAAYISELRTQPAGHISYREIAWKIFEALKEQAPHLAEGIAGRVTDPSAPLDFFKR
jgi:thymidylate synthase ThyX